VKYPALAISLIQLAMLLPVSLALLLVSEIAAHSVLLGGLLFIGPNAYFTVYAFRYSAADSADRVARSFYWGQFGKIVLTIVGFAVVLRLVQPLHMPALMAAYCLMIASQWFLACAVAKRMND
jgi:ATP synthase protein I